MTVNTEPDDAVGIFYAVLDPAGTFPLTNLYLLAGLMLSVFYYVGYRATTDQTLGKRKTESTQAHGGRGNCLLHEEIGWSLKR